MGASEAEFLAFIQEYRGIIVSAIRRVCGTASPSLLPDVEQDVYLALWQRLQHDWKRTPGDQRGRPSLELLKSEFPIRYLLLHAGAPEFMQRSARETSSFTLVHESSGGDRVYLVQRDGSGASLDRALREDQLLERRVTAKLRGAGTVNVSFNDQPLGVVSTAQGAPAIGAWMVAPGRIRRGLNWLHFESQDGSDFELLSVAAQ